MKKQLCVLFAALSISAGASASTSAPTVKFDGPPVFSNFCKAVIQDNVSLLKRSLRMKIDYAAANSTKRKVLRELVSERGMTCNNQSLINFAQAQDAENVYSLIKEWS